MTMTLKISDPTDQVRTLSAPIEQLKTPPLLAQLDIKLDLNKYNLQDDPGVKPGGKVGDIPGSTPAGWNPNTDNVILDPKAPSNSIKNTFDGKPQNLDGLNIGGFKIPNQDPRGDTQPFTSGAIAAANRLNGGSIMSASEVNRHLTPLYIYGSTLDPKALASIIEQKQNLVRITFDALASENNSRSLAVQRTEALFRQGLVSEEAFRNRLTAIQLNIGDARFLLDASSNRYSAANLSLQDRALTADLKRLDESIKVLDTKLQNAVELTKLQVQTAQINASTLVTRTDTAILSSKYNLSDLVRGQEKVLEGAVAPATRSGVAARAVVDDDKWARLPQVLGTESPLSVDQARQLRIALQPLTANPRDAISKQLPTDITPGSGFTPGQARAATADAESRLTNSLAKLNKLSDQDIKKTFGVTREQLAAEVNMLEKPVGTPIERGAYSQILSEIPSKVDYDAAWAKSKKEVEESTSVPTEVRQYIKGMEQDLYNAWVTSMAIYGSEKSIQAISTVGIAAGPIGLATSYTIAKGGIATFREITQTVEQNPSGWANLLGGFHRSMGIMNAARALEQSKTALMIRTESLDLTRQAYALSQERTGFDKTRTNQLYNSLTQRQEAVDLQYKNLGLTAQRTFVGEKVADVLEQSRKTDELIAKAQQANATVNRDAALGNNRFAATTKQQLIFEKNLSIAFNALTEFNGQQISRIVANGTGPLTIKTDTGLIVSRQNLVTAQRFVESQILGQSNAAGALASPASRLVLADDDPRVLKAAAVLTQTQFNKQYPDAAGILQSNGGNNTVGRVAISMFRDGRLAEATAFSPFNNNPVPNTLPQLERYPAGYIKVWSKPGEVESETQNVPRYIPDERR